VIWCHCASSGQPEPHLAADAAAHQHAVQRRPRAGSPDRDLRLGPPREWPDAHWPGFTFPLRHTRSFEGFPARKTLVLTPSVGVICLLPQSAHDYMGHCLTSVRGLLAGQPMALVEEKKVTKRSYHGSGTLTPVAPSILRRPTILATAPVSAAAYAQTAAPTAPPAPAPMTIPAVQPYPTAGFAYAIARPAPQFAPPQPQPQPQSYAPAPMAYYPVPSAPQPQAPPQQGVTYCISGAPQPLPFQPAYASAPQPQPQPMYPTVAVAPPANYTVAYSHPAQPQPQPQAYPQQQAYAYPTAAFYPPAV
jgi:hypothetical protein